MKISRNRFASFPVSGSLSVAYLKMCLSPRYLERNVSSTHYPSLWVTHSYYCICDRRVIRQCYYFSFTNWVLGLRKTDHNILKKLFRAYISVNEAGILNYSSKQSDLLKVIYKYYDRTNRKKEMCFHKPQARAFISGSRFFL